MLDKKYKYIIGIDEVGRGPLAGPVMVGAFAVHVSNQKQVLKELDGITDSKKITAKKREMYAQTIRALQKEDMVRVALSSVSAKLIDRHGIVPAIKRALEQSLEKLNIHHEECFVCLDGGLSAPEKYNQETLIKGDSKIWQIGAASVITKVTRDKHMVALHEKYPEYDFAAHKGYATKKHREAILRYGTCSVHRTSWIHF